MTCYLSNDCVTWYLDLAKIPISRRVLRLLYGDRDRCMGGVILRV